MIYIRCKTNIKKLILLITVISTTFTISSAQNTTYSGNGLFSDFVYITSNIYCPCGCGEVLSSCECETAVATAEEISKKLESGESADEILMDFVKLYGPSILLKSRDQQVENKKPEFDALPYYITGAGVTAYIAYFLSRKSSEKGKKEYKKR
jgi:cytochrome c-type biogenesis protein CcmH/NrfF